MADTKIPVSSKDKDVTVGPSLAKDVTTVGPSPAAVNQKYPGSMTTDPLPAVDARGRDYDPNVAVDNRASFPGNVKDPDTIDVPHHVSNPKDFTDLKDTVEHLYKSNQEMAKRIGNLEKSQQAFSHGKSGKLEESRHYCTDCGENVDANRCHKHPAAQINHAGIDPRTGTEVVIRTT